MSRSVVALLLTVVTADGPCSRERSRAVRRRVAEDLLPIGAEVGGGVEMQAKGCALHPSHDRFAKQEAAALRRGRRGLHRCGLCGKIFKTAAYLDRHLDRKHSDLLPANATVCPAAFYAMLRCDRPGSRSDSASGRRREPGELRKHACNEHDMRSLRFRWR